MARLKVVPYPIREIRNINVNTHLRLRSGQALSLPRCGRDKDGASVITSAFTSFFLARCRIGNLVEIIGGMNWTFD